MADESKIIETLDEQGRVIKFELYDIVEFEEKEYAMLLPVNAKEDDALVLMRLVNNDDDYVFEAIDDDEEFNAVSQYIESLED